MAFTNQFKSLTVLEHDRIYCDQKDFNLIKTATLNVDNSSIKQEWLDKLGSTQFLTKCRSGKISRDELHLFVKQQQLYSRHFTRYLSALLSNVEDDRDRLELTRNLFEEMGLGEAAGIPHSVLYQNMLANLGITPDETPLPATQQLIDTMFQCCRFPNYMVGLGALCLGAEAIVPYIYSIIVDGFLFIGESLENLEFFMLHIQCDDEHSETMLEIIAKELARNPNTKIDLYYGADKLIQARVDFFNGLTV
jgi:pyrroloquinoline quinone (PQQ) biosynthesis protein C